MGEKSSTAMVDREISVGEELPRLSYTQFNEATFLRLLWAQLFECDPRVLVDVGAANGSFARDFESVLSQVVFIEPSKARAARLRESFWTCRDVTIHEVAVRNGAAGRATLFNSPESFGISTLEPFHASHQAGEVVDVVALRDLGLPVEIDILKVDCEGLDLEVLQSLNWEAHKVGAIVAEFNGLIGNRGLANYQELCGFLESKGFFVITSEWHPIEKYGGVHSWRRLTLDEVPGEFSWGNVIAISGGPVSIDVIESTMCLALGSRGRVKPKAGRWLYRLVRWIYRQLSVSRTAHRLLNQAPLARKIRRKITR